MRVFLICCFLSLFHIMAAPLSATEPVEAYAQLPGVLDAAISPDGKAIAAIVENNGKYDLAVFEFEENSIKPNATGLHKDVIPLWIKWANNDYILVSFRENHSTGRYHIATGYMYTFNRDLSQSRELIEVKSRSVVASTGVKSGNRAKNKVIDFLPNDPEHILMSFSDDASNAPHVHKVNVATRKYSKVQHGLDYIDDWVTDLRGEVRVSQGRRNLDWSAILKIRDHDSDHWRDVSEFPGLDADAKVFGFTENPNEMIVGHYNDQNTLGLYIYDLAKKRWGRKLFQNSDYDVAGIVLSPDGSKVIGAQYVVDDISVEFFDPTSKARMDKIRASMIGYSPYFLDQTQDGRYVLIKTLSPDEPSKIILYDTQTNTPRVIGSDYPKLSGVQQGDVNAVRYTARDGTKIPAYVTLPHKVTDSGSLKDVPFIILPHGGPFARQTINFDSLAQFFANRGYGVLQMNFRGSRGYGREYEKAGRENWDIMQNDVEDGTRWLIEKGYADPERICIMGWSYGGYAALLAAARSSELYQCAISMAAITDLEAYLSHRVKRRYAKGNFYENSLSHFIAAGLGERANVRDNSPKLLAGRIDIPVLIAHGERDAVVGFHHFRRMEKALKKAGVQYTAVRLENSDHSLRDGAGRVKFFTAMDKFLEEHLGKSEYAP